MLQGHQVNRRYIPVIVGVLLFILGLLAGSQYFGAEMSGARQTIKNLAAERAAMAEQLAEVTRLRVARDVDKKALQHLQESVTELNARLAEQRKEVMLYRNLLKTGGMEDGLHIVDASIVPFPEASAARYSFVIRQKADLLKTVAIQYTAELKGLLDGAPVAYSLADLDAQVEKMPVKTKLKYFTVVEGRLDLPPKFVAQSLQISTWSDNKPAQRRELILNWPRDEDEKNAQI